VKLAQAVGVPVQLSARWQPAWSMQLKSGMFPQAVADPVQLLPVSLSLSASVSASASVSLSVSVSVSVSLSVYVSVSVSVSVPPPPSSSPPSSQPIAAHSRQHADTDKQINPTFRMLPLLRSSVTQNLPSQGTIVGEPAGSGKLREDRHPLSGRR
jgi:hypothetical protein